MSRSVSNRREFLRSAAVASAGAVVPYWWTAERARAADSASQGDRPKVGLIAAGGRGTFDAQCAIGALGQSGRPRGPQDPQWTTSFGEIAAICDVDRRQAEKANEALGGKADIYDDYRRLLDRKDIELVINATPDHWHTAITIDACKAGKDVYAEKPLTLTIDEGKILSRVVEQTGRIVQVGTQARSERRFHLAIELVRNGRVGKLKQVWVAIPHYSSKGGPFPKETVPKELNWEMYQGQAPLHDYCRRRTHGTFRNWREYAGGLLADWGSHHIDTAHWGMDCDLGGPLSVEARGVFPNPEGPEYYNTPNRFFARLMYPGDVEMLFFVAPLEPVRAGRPVDVTPEETEQLFGKDAPEEVKTLKRNGIMFIGDKERLFINRSGVYGKPVEDLNDNPLPDDAWRAFPYSTRDHMGNFFECVKSRRQPSAPVAIAHRAVTVCHLANISILLKRKIAWDPVKQQIVGDEEANAMLRREQRAPYGIRG